MTTRRWEQKKYRILCSYRALLLFFLFLSFLSNGANVAQDLVTRASYLFSLYGFSLTPDPRRVNLPLGY
jgi:hypothetical protein